MREGLLADPAKLAQVLTCHVLAGTATAAEADADADADAVTNATMVQGGALKMDASDGVRVNDATVVRADLPADNRIHAIDTVLLPA